MRPLLIIYGKYLLFSLKKKQAIFPEFEYLARDGSVWRSWSHLAHRRLIILVHKFHATLIPPNSGANVIIRDASLRILLVIFAM